MLVLAGPGSGKTFVITSRTRYLIEEHGIDPRNILVITFTKAAADEMKERFLTLMKGVNLGVTFGTFHSVFFKILKYAYHYNANNIIREEDRYRVFSEIVNKLKLEIEDEKDFIEGISSEISFIKGEGMKLDHYYSLNCSDEDFKKIYEEYDNYLRRSNLIDFDDMIVFCYELLKARPDILALWQKQYRYFMIDEAQDSNRLQFEIIKLLAAKERNIFLVGDDDQSLYRFRGAKPEILLNFHLDYPDRKLVLLDTNYRSQSKIMDGALRVIQNNANRFEKAIKAERAPGNDIHIQGFLTVQDQNKAVLEEIRNLYLKDHSYHNIAILFRTNSQPRALVELFMEYNIPFRMKDSIPNIYEHWITKNIISYIKIALGDRERSQFLQIINRPKRYIARDCFGSAVVDFNNIKQYYLDRLYVVERIEKLEYDLAMLKSMGPYAAINYIRKVIGYDEYLKEYAEYRRMKEEDLLELLDEIQDSAKDYKTYQEWFEHMEEYKKELIEQMNRRNKKDTDSVSFMTFHSAKGLEFDTVFIIDANEGITPHRKAIADADLEEERRMFYVAMTRAKNNLYIYSVKERYNKELDCSRFVGELLMNSEDLQAGKSVKHKLYGNGTILKSEKGKLTVKFDNSLLPKVLDQNYCIQKQVLELL